MSRKAANIVSTQVILNPGITSVLASGNTPIGMYRQLIEWYHKGDIDFSEVETVNLDEYIGLSKTDEQSYYHFISENFSTKQTLTKDISNFQTERQTTCQRNAGAMKTRFGDWAEWIYRCLGTEQRSNWAQRTGHLI